MTKKEKNKEYIRSYRLKNKEKQDQYVRDYNLKNRDKSKKYREDNKENRKIWRSKNKDKIAKYQKNRKERDPGFRLISNIRRRQNKVLKGITSSTEGLGCNSEFLKKHIESQFKEGMNWSNYGNKQDQWSIDHILPMSLFYKNPELLNKLIHYTNLQPMWCIENSKKGNRL